MISLENEFVISVGAKYRVNHGDEEPTEGVFKGFSAIASETALVFELDDGMLRFISLPQIIYLDLLEAAPKAKSSKRKDSGSVYYG